MTKKAIVIGLDRYQNSPLYCCHKDAERVHEILIKEGFSVRLVPEHTNQSLITRADIKREANNLFSCGNSVTTAIFYFAGHGIIRNTGGVLLAEKFTEDDPGFGMNELLEIVNKSDIPSKFVFLDCCHSGAFGDFERHADIISGVGKGVTLIAACRSSEKAAEMGIDGGEFTSLMVKGLKGGAADRAGRINAPSLYVYIDENMDLWSEQQCVYKANVETTEPIRTISQESMLKFTAKRGMKDLIEYVSKSKEKHQRAAVMTVIDESLAEIQQLRYQYVDWGEGAKKWIEEFYSSIIRYDSILTTDLESRSSIGSPVFERYLRHQYKVRTMAISSALREIPLVLKLSTEVADAVHKTGWKPDPTFWSTENPKNLPVTGPEMVRVLIRKSNRLTPAEVNALWVLDYDHRLYGIPLFVVYHDKMLDLPDFAVGIDVQADFVKCYEFIEERCEVESQTEERGKLLRKKFFNLLSSVNLTLVQEYIGKVMIKDPGLSYIFSQDYDSYREKSDLIVELISKRIPSEENICGLDIGCGTGNYICPFVTRFKNIVGLDIDPNMIDIATEKLKPDDNVELVCADAVSIPCNDNSIDFSWSVSMLHYLIGERKKRFLYELYRIMKIGGQIFLDIGEFAEQHPSLWVVHYFPSLIDRYKDSLHTQDDYKNWLESAGFSAIEFISIDYPSTEKDLVLRSGQNKPSLYTEGHFQRSLPAFREMSKSELLLGVEKLQADIDSGNIQAIITDYKSRATISGDIGFIHAKKER